MNFKKQTIILGVILLLLIGFYLPSLFFSRETQQKRALSIPLITQTDLSNAGSLVLKNVEGEVVLIKGNNWYVQYDGISYPAKQDKIQGYIDILKGLKIKQQVGSSSDVWDVFGIDDDSESILIKDNNGQEILRLFCGDSSADGLSVYVRIEGDDAVYSVDNTFLPYLSQDRQNWSDLALFPAALNYSNLASLSLSDNILKTSFSFFADSNEGETLWTDSNQIILDQEKVKTLLRTLVDSSAYDFTSSDLSEEDPVFTVNFDDTEGKSFMLTIYGLVDETYYLVRTSQSEFSYLLDTSLVERLMQPAEYYLPALE